MNQHVMIILLVVLTFCHVSTQQSDTGTSIIFYVEREIEQPDDYVQINFQIKSQKTSLDAAISQAKGIVKKVENLINQYCKTHSKNKKQCKDAVVTSVYQIDPIYQLVRKVPTFVAFSVTHETIAKIQQVKQIGKLTDDILKSGISKINSFEWKPYQQVNNQQDTVFQGISQANRICQKVGLKLDRIVSVSEITQYDSAEQEQQEKKKQDGQEQQEGESDKKEQEQQEQTTITYKFQILCEGSLQIGKDKGVEKVKEKEEEGKEQTEQKE